ncbi:UNKNOWN [Stylonychia lemnae]|uniref:Uncharacterized protein n=1 Tax=Stylonychia lemnae TaxID=5949 RepID=A0A077ZPH0_STYLE|nr:UNKNOWN [Stylonychia lemnae]|eukprot:CDW71867.1 UNKNOWN [Stylonychia lemnae]
MTVTKAIKDDRVVIIIIPGYPMYYQASNIINESVKVDKQLAVKQYEYRYDPFSAPNTKAKKVGSETYIEPQMKFIMHRQNVKTNSFYPTQGIVADNIKDPDIRMLKKPLKDTLSSIIPPSNLESALKKSATEPAYVRNTSECPNDSPNALNWIKMYQENIIAKKKRMRIATMEITSIWDPINVKQGGTLMLTSSSKYLQMDLTSFQEIGSRPSGFILLDDQILPMIVPNPFDRNIRLQTKPFLLGKHFQPTYKGIINYQGNDLFAYVITIIPSPSPPRQLQKSTNSEYLVATRERNQEKIQSPKPMAITLNDKKMKFTFRGANKEQFQFQQHQQKPLPKIIQDPQVRANINLDVSPYVHCSKDLKKIELKIFKATR